VLDAISHLARDQHGVVHLDDIRPLGATTSWCSRQTARGLLDRRAPAVYALAGAPRTRRQELLVHVRAAGSGALSTGDSALGLWCPELELPPQPEIVVPMHCGYRAPGVRLWRSADLHLAKPTVRDGIPTVGVVRALLDASRGRTPDEVEGLIDACRRHLPISIGALVEGVHVHQRRGRPGIATFRKAVVGLRREVSDSDFERFVLRDLARAGVPVPRLHHVVRLPDEDPIELDIDWPGVLLDIELDGRDHVERRRAARRDRQRDRLLQAAGYVVARYTWDDYVSDRDAMIAEIGRFFDQCSNP
jgi:hypothetical protein